MPCSQATLSWPRSLDGGLGAGWTMSPAAPPETAGAVGSDPDLALMLSVKAGNSDAFNLLMGKYQRTVVNLAYRFTGDADAAQDLAQEVFLRIYRASERFEARAKFFTYLYKVTLNLCRNARDKSKRRQAKSLSEDPLEGRAAREVADPAGSAADTLDRQELSEVVRRAILELPEEQRQLVILQRFEGLSYEEIGDLTSQSVSAVKSKLHRAKLGLKKRLAPYLGETSGDGRGYTCAVKS